MRAVLSVLSVLAILGMVQCSKFAASQPAPALPCSSDVASSLQSQAEHASVIDSRASPTTSTPDPAVQASNRSLAEGFSQSNDDNPARTGDLSPFLEMDDTVQAAKLLREHAAKHRLNLEQVERTGPDEEELIKMGKKPRSWEKLPARGFNGKEINLPNGTAPDLARHAFNGQDGREQVVCVIQINQSPALGDIANLLEAGVRFYGPLKPDTILARIPLDSVNGLSAISIIQSVAPYGPEYKAIEPGQQEVKYGAYLYLFDGDRPEYRADLDRLGLTIRSYDSSSIMYVVDMDPKRIGWLAEQLWWIRGIAPIFKETAFMLPKTTVNFEANDSRDLIDAYSSGYSGQGVTVGVKDSAIYEQHPDLQGVLHANSDTGGVDKHGTHVTGIIAGRSASLDGPSGFREIKGVAWDASILFRSGIEIGNETISESFNIFINNGIQISNHSYGYTNKFDYDNTSKDIDGYCDNWDMVVVFAAGNEGDRGSETISSSGAPAKNTLTVGAIEYCTDPVGFSIIGRRAAYSGQGPSLDRLKPDIVAPGGMGGYMVSCLLQVILGCGASLQWPQTG